MISAGLAACIALAGPVSAGTIVVNGVERASNDGLPGQDENMANARANLSSTEKAGNPDRATNRAGNSKPNTTSDVVEFND